MRDIASALYSREKIGQERGEKVGDKAGRQALSALLQKLLQEGKNTSTASCRTMNIRRMHDEPAVMSNREADSL